MLCWNRRSSSQWKITLNWAVLCNCLYPRISLTPKFTGHWKVEKEIKNCFYSFFRRVKLIWKPNDSFLDGCCSNLLVASTEFRYWLRMPWSGTAIYMRHPTFVSDRCLLNQITANRKVCTRWGRDEQHGFFYYHV